MMKHTHILVALGLTGFSCAQSSFSGLSLHTGLSFNVGPNKYTQLIYVPYKHGADVQGVSLDLGFEYQFKKIPLSLTVFSRCAYDYRYTDVQWSGNGANIAMREVNGFIFDPYIQLKYHYSKKRNHYVGISHSFHNIGGHYFVQGQAPNKYLHYYTDYQSTGVMVGHNIYKNIFLEAKFEYIKSYQTISNFNAYFYGISFKYNFPLNLKLIP